MTGTYDVAVLGGGPGGCTAALRAALRGASVCLVESGLLGGTCLNVGCIPTKAMLHASELAFQAARAGQFGINAERVSVDGEAFMARPVNVVAQLRRGLSSLVNARKIEVISGRGRLTGPDVLEVDGEDAKQAVRAKSVILATGSRPARADFAPWDSPRVMTTDQAATAERLPESVIIVGGGVIGCEFATIYGECGIETHLIEIMPTLLPGVAEDAERIVTRSLKQRGVQIYTSAEITAMVDNDDAVTAVLAGGRSISAAAALVVVGRQPNIEDIGLEAIGVAMRNGVVEVDDRCRTNVPGLYAVGDVAERRQYAHLAARMGIVAADNATGHSASDDRTIVPECLYTHPEVASVGLGEAEAAKLPGEVRSHTFPLSASGMAQAFGRPDGLVTLVARAETGELVGGLVVGPHAPDVIAVIATAMRSGMSVAELAEVIHAHPTFAEAVGEAAAAWLGLPVHTLK